MKCYFCNKTERLVPEKRRLYNGEMVPQCIWCFKCIETGLKLAEERGYYDPNKKNVSGGDNMKASKDAVGGDFLKAGYVEEHKITELKIMSEVSIARFEKEGKPTVEKFQFGIEYEGFSKNKGMPDTWTLNSKSKNALIDAWGDETDDWKGKTTPITLSGDGEYRHIMVDTLRIK